MNERIGQLNKFIKIVLSLTFLCFLGCASSTKYYRDIPFDHDAKSISIEPGGTSLHIKLKEYFKSQNYKIVSTPGDSVGKRTDAITTVVSPEHKTRYRLYLDAVNVGSDCLVSGSKFSYTLSIVDLEKGGEVLSMSGRDCEDNIKEKFIRELNGMSRPGRRMFKF